MKTFFITLIMLSIAVLGKDKKCPGDTICATGSSLHSGDIAELRVVPGGTSGRVVDFTDYSHSESWGGENWGGFRVGNRRFKTCKRDTNVTNGHITGPIDSLLVDGKWLHPRDGKIKFSYTEIWWVCE